MNKKLVLPFITFLLLVATGISALTKGIEHHEVWRIWVSSISLLLTGAFVVLIIRQQIKELKAVPVKNR